MECPLCGSRLRGTGAGAGSEPPQPAPAWEDPSIAFPGNLLQTWRRSLFTPTAFYRAMQDRGTLARPLLYYLVISVISAFFVLVWRSVAPLSLREMLGPQAPLTPLVQFFFEPFAALIGLGVGVLLLQLFVLILIPASAGMRVTARVFCYAWGPAVFTAVPILGPVVGLIWSIVLLVVGLREAHGTTSARAAAAVLLPVGLVFLALLLLTVLLVMAGLATGELLRW